MRVWTQISADQPRRVFVVVGVEIENHVQWFYQYFDTDFIAEAVREKEAHTFHDTIETIRREAYEAGWANAKGKKRRKARHFANTLFTGHHNGGCY